MNNNIKIKYYKLGAWKRKWNKNRIEIGSEKDIKQFRKNIKYSMYERIEY